MSVAFRAVSCLGGNVALARTVHRPKGALQAHVQATCRALFAPCRPCATVAVPSSVHRGRIASVAAAASDASEKLPKYCCGCGVKLQDQDPDKQGFYTIPKKVLAALESGDLSRARAGVLGAQGRGVDSDEGRSKHGSDIIVLDFDAHAKINDDPEFIVRPLEAGEDPMVDEATAGSWRRRHEPPPQQAADPLKKMLQITCARCHKLTYEGRVKSEVAEAELPPFDLAAVVGTTIKSRVTRRAVVLVVVDIADFDGSLPRSALSALLPRHWTPNSADKLPFELVYAVNKMDTLPRTASHPRVEAFVRRRVKQGGLPPPDEVHLVSSVCNIGVRRLLQRLVRRVGLQGDLWVVGAQNVGKSSLINALKRQAGTLASTAPLTTAALPGTTLGLVPIEGLPLQPRSRCFDTPGVPHPHQLTSRLSGGDVKTLLAREKPLKPRTYRIGAGTTLLIAGVARIDIVAAPARTIYLSVWASDLLPLHVGKTEGAHNRWLKFVGNKLSPPSAGTTDIEALGPLVPTAASVTGSEWQQCGSDICIAGLGWVGVGVRGTAEFTVWAHEGVAVTTRDALMPDYAARFERPGWSENSKMLHALNKPQGGRGHDALDLSEPRVAGGRPNQ